MTSTKKILVTGSNGQLGKCLQQLVQENPNPNYHYLFTDSTLLNITNNAQVESFFFANKFDYVVNCAAYTAVDKAETEIEQAFKVNADAVGLLAKECNEQKAIFIHISTDYVFDGNKNTPYTVDDQTNPQSVYGKSKLEGEKLALKNNKKTIIIRTSWVYSEYGSNFVKTMKRLFKEKSELNIVNDQFGKPTNALKLAEKIIQIILNPQQNFGIFHYASDKEQSWYDFAMEIKSEEKSEIKLMPIPTSQYPTPAKRPQYSVLEVNI